MTTQNAKTNLINSQVKPQTQKILKIDLTSGPKQHQSLSLTKDLRSPVNKSSTG